MSRREETTSSERGSGIWIPTSIQSSDHRKRVSGARASQEHNLSRQLIHIHQMSEIKTRYVSVFEENTCTC